MGYMRHHAIVVTGSYDGWTEVAHQKAKEIFGAARVSGIVKSKLNSYKSFLVPPDGSKEGWVDSDDGDRSRALFVKWLNAQRYEDGSSPLKWIEVFYGDDDGEAHIENQSGTWERQ